MFQCERPHYNLRTRSNRDPFKVESERHYLEMERYFLLHDYSAAGRHCQELDSKLAALGKEQPENNIRIVKLRGQVLLDLSRAYSACGFRSKAILAAEKAIRFARRAKCTDLAMHYYYLRLYRTLDPAKEYDRARNALIASMTCFLSVWQSQWVADGLSELSDLEATHGDPLVSEKLQELASGIIVLCRKSYLKSPEMSEDPGEKGL